MVRSCAQCRSPDGGTEAIEQQIAAWRVAGQANGHWHDGTQAVDKTETEYPDVRVTANMFQCAVAHQLPARLARQQLAPVPAAHEVPELVAGVAAEESN